MSAALPPLSLRGSTAVGPWQPQTLQPRTIFGVARDAKERAPELIPSRTGSNASRSNRLQAPALLEELARLRRRLADENGKELLLEIDQLVREALEGVHLYIKIPGRLAAIGPSPPQTPPSPP